MDSIEIQIEQYISQIIKELHRNLADNFTFTPETRDLSAYQSQILQQIDRNSAQYKSLTGILAVDSYLKYIIDLLVKSQPILEIIALLFNDMSILEDFFEHVRQNSTDKHLEQTWVHLAELAELSHGLFPNSPYVNVHRQFIQGHNLDVTETIYTNLHHRNQILEEKLKENDRHIIQLQLKLTKIIQQNEDFDSSVDSSAKIFELKQMIVLKDRQIQSMNQQFNFQIEKYNTVYQVIKKQNDQLKKGRNMDLYGMINVLENEISRLKQEKQKDQMVIADLRDRLTNPSKLKKVSSYSRLYY